MTTSPDRAGLTDYQRGYIDGFDAPKNIEARTASPDRAGLLREANSRGADVLFPLFKDMWERGLLDASITGTTAQLNELAERYGHDLAALAATGDSEGPGTICKCGLADHDYEPRYPAADSEGPGLEHPRDAYQRGFRDGIKSAADSERPGLTTERAAGLHGVAVVDVRGPECICGRDFPYRSGGWLAFNEHLAERFAAASREAGHP